MSKKSLKFRSARKLEIYNRYSNLYSKLFNIILFNKNKFNIYYFLKYIVFKNVSKCRIRYSCILTNRYRGYYKYFGLSRIKLCELILILYIPNYSMV